MHQLQLFQDELRLEESRTSIVPYNRVLHRNLPFCLPLLSHIRENFLRLGSGFLRLCCHIVPIRSMSEFPDASSFFVLFRFPWNEFPRTRVHFCNFLPHWRTRRCVFLIWFSRYRFPCALLNMLTGCPECVRTWRCSWTLHSR